MSENEIIRIPADKLQAIVHLPEEAKVAAKWWADRLRGDCKMQSGDPMTRLLSPRHAEQTDIIDVLSMLSNVRELSSEQIDVFEATLAAIVAETYCKTWDIKNPMFGSACRTLAVDYGACDELRAAYQYAGGGQHVTVFPIKTVMWVNPGSVKVRYGYGGKEVELMVK